MDLKFIVWYVIDVYFEYIFFKLSYLNALSYKIGTPMTILSYICISMYINVFTRVNIQHSVK